jgi:ankyrin repeat protein
MESIKDAAEMGKAEKHNCSTMSMLYLLYGQDKDKIKNGSSEYTVTLSKAAYFGYVGTAKLLIDSGAEVNELHSQLGTTALHIAMSQGYVDVATELLYAGADVDALNTSGLPALALAVQANNTELCKLLLEFGASASPASLGVQ